MLILSFWSGFFYLPHYEVNIPPHFWSQTKLLISILIHWETRTTSLCTIAAPVESYPTIEQPVALVNHLINAINLPRKSIQILALNKLEFPIHPRQVYLANRFLQGIKSIDRKVWIVWCNSWRVNSFSGNECTLEGYCYTNLPCLRLGNKNTSPYQYPDEKIPGDFDVKSYRTYSKIFAKERRYNPSTNVTRQLDR